MPVINNKKNQGKDAAVQGTNDSSVVSKVSAAAQGYFQDEFLQHFVCKVSRRAPLINRGYYVRWQAVDSCVKKFLQVTDSCVRRQILSLGAGFDSLYFRLHAERALECVTVFEVDFPDVVRRKASLINGNDLLRAAVPDWDYLAQTDPCADPAYVSSTQYKLLGVDVRNERRVEEALTKAGLQWDSPTLVLSEVVLTYMEIQWSDAVISWAAKILPHALLVMYEQIRPEDPFGIVMQNHFLKLNSKIHALCQYPNISAQTQRFLNKGWEKCVCLDMNQFYFSLLTEDERSRVEKLEPFDEFEEWHQKCSHYFILTASKGSLTTQALLPAPVDKHGFETLIPLRLSEVGSLTVKMQLIDEAPCVQAVGMASSMLEPGLLLLTGGCGRRGRNTAATVLISEQGVWKHATVEPQGERCLRLYHTMTSVPGCDSVILGGRISPLNPIDSVLRVSIVRNEQPNLKKIMVSMEKKVCTGLAPKPRWRHTATLLRHGDKSYIFVFGGRSESEPVLGDAHFLHFEDQHWTDIPLEGCFPEPRHSHSACAYRGGVVIFGGLGRKGFPLGDIVLLKPTSTGFCWERLQVQPVLIPRYSHSAHVIGENLVVVGGVWLHEHGVPGVAVINMTSRVSVEINLDTSSVPWPLMLHSFCSELLDSDRAEMVLIGGGGNCFSFGTHLNARPVTVDLRPALNLIKAHLET